METKRCYVCGETKGLSEFNKNKSKKDGLRDSCKDCDVVLRKEWKSRNKDKVLKAKKRYRIKNKAKEHARKVEREATLIKATPSWALRTEINSFYEAAKAFQLYTGIEYHVDHIVPLRSRIVCGLHCEANLQVLDAKTNMSKSNKWWPDMP
jgi:hypothetical protein